jgi:hypothetical protein
MTCIHQWLLAPIVLLYTSAPLHAVTTLTLSIDYVGPIDETTLAPAAPSASLNAIPSPNLITTAGPTASSVNILHQFEVFFKIDGAAANEDFWGLLFDMTLGPGVIPADFGGWVGHHPIYDPPGPYPPNSIFQLNVDQGANPNDLRIIRVYSPGSIYAAGAQAGEEAAAKIGEVWVKWNGDHNSSSRSFLGIATPPVGTTPWGLFVNDVATAQPDSTMSVGPRSEWNVVPEPPSATLLGLALVGSLALIRQR